MTGTRKRKIQNPKKSQTNEREDSQAKNQHPLPTASTSKCPKFSDNKRPSSQDIRKYINVNSQDFADENIDIETELNKNDSIDNDEIHENEPSLQESDEDDLDPTNTDMSDSDSSDEDEIDKVSVFT